MVRWAVLGLSQDEDWTDLFEHFGVNSLKGDLSNNITVNQPRFSLVITVKESLGKTAGAAVVKLRFNLQNWATAELSEGTDFLDKSFFLTFYRKKGTDDFPRKVEANTWKLNGIICKVILNNYNFITVRYPINDVYNILY